MKKRLIALLLTLALLPASLCGAAEEEKEPYLILNAAARYPKESYPLDLLGKTEYIPYLLTITNAGEAPCALQSLCCRTGASRTVDAFQDTVLAAGKSMTILYEQRFSRDDLLPGTENEGALGVVEIAFTVSGGENGEYPSNEARLSHFISASPAQGFPASDADLVRAELKALTQSVHPAGYQAGEKIAYQAQVENRSSLTLPALLLEEITSGDEAARKIGMVNDLAPGEKRTVVFTHTVENKDLERGYLYSLVSASWQDPATGEALISRSVPAVAMTLRGVSTPQPSGDGVQLTASFVSEPANGAYYVPGETVRVALRMVNASSSALNQVRLTDLGTDAAEPIAVIPSLLPGEEAATELAYTVTGLDALLGRACFFAAVQAADVYGTQKMTVSDLIAVPVGQAEENKTAARASQSLALVQRETSAPAQGGAYQAGETVSYEILVFNTDDQSVWDLWVCDILAEGPDGHIGRAERLSPGDFARFTFDHTVTEAEERAGRVAAWAFAVAEQDGVILDLCRADAPVVSPAGKGNAVSRGSFDLPLAGDGCSLTLLAKGSNAAEYSQHYCVRHAERSKTVNDLIARAETEEALLAAWEQAAALWTEELETLYAEYLEAASGTARMAVTRERIACLEALKSWRGLMEQVHSDAPVQAVQATAEEAMRLCLSLCGDGYSANGTRTDSLFRENAGKIVSASAADGCDRLTLLSQDETVQYRDLLCASHSTVMEAAAALLENAEDGQNARDVWFSALRTRLNKLYEKGGKKIQSAAADYALRMEAYLTAHAETLALLYPDDPQTAREAAAQSAMRCVLALCREEAE